MGNCLSKRDNKSFAFVCTKPITSVDLKKLVSSIEKSQVKSFATGIKKYSCIRHKWSIKSSLTDVSIDFLHNPLSTIHIIWTRRS